MGFQLLELNGEADNFADRHRAWRTHYICRCSAVELRKLGQSEVTGWSPTDPDLVFRTANDLLHDRQGIVRAIQARRLFPLPGSASPIPRIPYPPRCPSSPTSLTT